MTRLTTKLYFSLTKFAPYVKLAGLGLALLSAACGEASAMDVAQQMDVVDVPEAMVYVDSIEFAPSEAEQLAAVGVEEPGDMWLDSCNLCILTEDGAYCTSRDCDTYDPSAVIANPVTCEDGAYVEGDVWVDEDNTCFCTGDHGTVCTVG